MQRINGSQWKLVLAILSCALLATACGSGGGGNRGELDRAGAAKAIQDSIKADESLFLKGSGKILQYTEREPATTPPQYQAYCNASKDQQESLAKMAEKGLLKIDNDQKSGCSYVTVLEKGASFAQKKDKTLDIILAKVEKVEITEVGTGKQTRTVKYKVSFTPTPFGEVLLKLSDLTQEKEAGFTLVLDEGWKIN